MLTWPSAPAAQVVNGFQVKRNVPVAFFADWAVRWNVAHHVMNHTVLCQLPLFGKKLFAPNAPNVRVYIHLLLHDDEDGDQ